MPQSTVGSFRQHELMQQYTALLDRHIQDLKAGLATHTLEIRDFAAELHVHPVHLSNTVKEVTGRSTCHLYEERLLVAAKELLADRRLSIAQVAARLCYDPSNFTKFFKRYDGQTPKAYRSALAESEVVTILS